MDQLKLVALDEQDLNIISAHVQDAVMKVGDLEFLPNSKRFVSVECIEARLADLGSAWEASSLPSHRA